MRTLTLYSRPACHLCQDMEHHLRRLGEDLGFALEVIDIDRDPALVERFGTLVPVLMGDEAEICHYFLDEVALRRYLGQG